MTMTTKRWFHFAASVCVLALLAAFQNTSNGEGTTQTVRLNIQPLPAQTDPGPTALIGGETQPGGNPYSSMDVFIDGPGDCRIYFDFKDKDHFHFMDRAGSEVTLGLRESGVEQIFAKGAVSGESLRLARHGCKMGVFQNGALIANAFDDRILDGGVGYRMNGPGAAVKLRAEARDDIHFVDDFMIAGGRPEQWRSSAEGKTGYFEVIALKNPLLSANAFSYFGAGPKIHSVTGETWWDNYTYDLSMRGPETGVIGLVFAYQDPQNYGLFRWGSRGINGKAATSKREIVLVRNGAEEVLAQASGGYAPDQWYQGTVSLSYSRVSVYVDKHLMLETSNPYLMAGAAGVWCDVPVPPQRAKDPKEQDFSLNSLWDLMRQHAVFDDVRIRSQEDYEERFATPGALKSGWLCGEGDWNVAASKKTPGANALTVQCAGATKALIGDRRWSQYQVSADIQPLSKEAAAGIVLMHRDESNYYVAKVEGGMLKLVRVAGGVERVEDNAQLPAGNDPIHILASVKRGHIRAVADDTASVEAFEGSTRLKGRAGIYVKSGGASAPSALVSSFKVAFLPEPEPLVTMNAIFDEEVSMNDWSNAAQEWVPPPDIFLVDGKPVSLFWHRSQFPGDVELMLEPREITENNYQFALSCSKDGMTHNNGYVFRYRASDDKNGQPNVHVEILRNNEKVIERQLTDVRQLSSVAIRRAGKFVIGLVNGRAVLSFRDNDPLKGSKVAYYTSGVLVKNESARITSDHFHNDTFSGAPVNWRTAGYAIAEVTNRWQCDPRWTFFSLQNDIRSGGKPAVLWSKQIYPGDCTVEFYFGNKMDHMRGNPYSYARDVNVTIGSDGQDLRKGYTFSFGGYGNTCCYIMRDGVEVKRVSARIPTGMDYHRHWFAFKAERQGKLVKFRVDHFFQDNDKKTSDLVFEDSQPLAGDRVAIWTYDHGIMISKVRISGDDGETTEDPDFIPGPVKTVYDK